MKYSEILPSPHLRKHIKCFWVLRQAAPSGSIHRETVLPDGSLEIVFNLADRFRRFHADGIVELQPLTIAVGQMRRSVQIQATGKIDLFGIRFFPTGAYHFFRRALDEITDRIVELDPLLDSIDRSLIDQIHEAATTAGRVQIIERCFGEMGGNANSRELAVDATTRLISDAHGAISIRQLSRDVGVSQRQLERHFRKMVGVSPKFYSRIARMRAILNASRSTCVNDMLDLALSYGYYDQSHFIREFSEFAGASPTVFLQSEHKLDAAFASA